MFKKDAYYKRQTVHEKVGGGDPVNFLPTKGGKVLCAFLRRDSNPDAPHVVLVGTGEKNIKNAHTFRDQASAVPVFLKEGNKPIWRFLRYYAATNLTQDTSAIERYGRKSELTEITRVLFLEEQIHQDTSQVVEEVSGDEKFFEGHVRRVTVNRYERDPKARSTCIEHYGTQCNVCDFDFAKRYGAIGKGLIHVHHERQLSDLDGDYEVDPIEDMKPVCPNCHAIIHRRRPPYSTEEVRSMLL